MSDMGWRADGIARARAVGGVELERYRRPGFTGGMAVRVVAGTAGGEGFEIESDPDPDDGLFARVPRTRMPRHHRRW